jgi:predicted cupin superfamily sugar epimerase
MNSPEDLISIFDLQPLPGEGGLWSPIFRNKDGNAIHFMMISPDFSAWHRLTEPELWVHIAGAPIDLFTIENNRLIQTLLAKDGPINSFRVPPNIWMAARPKGGWSLAICALTPPFSGMELGNRKQLSEEFPNLEIPELFHG